MNAIAYSLVELDSVILIVVFYDNENNRFIGNFYAFVGADVYSAPIGRMFVEVNGRPITKSKIKKLGRKIAMFITKILAFGTSNVYELRDTSYTIDKLFAMSKENQISVHGVWPKGHDRL